MSIFDDKTVAANWFSDWDSENRANHRKEIETHQIILGREQFMRAKELQLREKDQDILKKTVEANIKVQNDVMAMLQRFESRLHSNEKNEDANAIILEANETVDVSNENTN